MQHPINQQAQAQQLAQQVDIPGGGLIQQQQSMKPSPQTHPLPGLEAPVAFIGQHPMQMPNAMNVPIPGVRGPTPQEIMNIRNHPSGKMAQATDEQIRIFLMRNQQAQMQQQQQMTPQQLQLQKQQTLRRMQMQQQKLQQPGQALQNPNIAIPATAVMPAQIPQQTQQPKQPNQQARGNLIREQVAALDPENRKKYEAMMRAQASQASHQQGANQSHANRAGQPNPEQHAKYRAIEREEDERGKEPLPDIPMDSDTKASTEELLKAIVPPLNNVGRVVLRWYLVTLDDVRIRAFFRAVSYPLLFGLFEFTADTI
jgi:hypothetical protein